MSDNRVERVNKIMREARGSCSQAIFAVYGEYLSSGKIDQDTCMKIASGFGGGIVRSGNVCGALTGAIMALGLKYGGSEMEAKINEVAMKLLNEFQAHHGSILCKDLIRQDLITDEDIQKAFQSGAFNKCFEYVDDVANMLEKLI